MPFTDEQKRNILINAGVDPEKYDYDETSSSAVPRVSFKPPVKQEPAQTPPVNTQPFNPALTRGEAFKAVGGRSVVPTIAGVGSGALAAQAFPGSHAFPPWTELGAALIGGIAGGYGASKGQEAILEAVQGPEAYQKGVAKVEEARKQYPIQSFGAEVAPGLLFGRPSISGLKGAGKLLGRKVLTEGEKAAVKMAAIQAGTSAGGDVASQSMGEEPYSIGRTVGAAGAGALLSKPFLLGKTRFAGFQPETAPVVQQDQTQPTASIAPKTVEFTPPEVRGSARGTVIGEGMDLPTALRPDIQQAADAAVALRQTPRVARPVGQELNLPTYQPRVQVVNPNFQIRRRSNIGQPLRTQGEIVQEQGRTINYPERATATPSPEQISNVGEILSFSGFRPQTGEVVPVRSAIKQPQPQPTAKLQTTTPEPVATTPNPLQKAQQVLNSTPDEFLKMFPGGTLKDVKELGTAIKDNPTLVDQVKTYQQQAEQQMRDLLTAGNPEEAVKISTKAQYFREAIEAATGTGSAKDLLVTTPKEPEGTLRTSIDLALENLKLPLSRAETSLFGLTQSVWNTLIDGIRLAIKGGFKVADAIENAIAKIKSQGHKFDEDGARAYLQGARISDLQPEGSTTPIESTTTEALKSDTVRDPLSIVDRFNPIRSGIDTIRKMGTPTAGKVADAFNSFYQKFRALKGEYLADINQKLLRKINPLLTPGDWLVQDNASNRKVLLALYKESETKQPATNEINSFSPDEKELYSSLRQLFLKSAQDQIARGIKVEGVKGELRERGTDPFYMPHVMDSEVINTILNKPSSPEAIQFQKDFIEYRTSRGQKLEEAIGEWDELKNAFGGVQSNIASQFGPVDKAEGKGLPLSMREKNLTNAVNKYFKRVARRFAYFDTVESNPEIRTALGIKTDPITGGLGEMVQGVDNIAGADSVKQVLGDITGNRSRSELKRESLAGVIRSLMLGLQTGAVDFTTNLSGGLHYFTPAQAVQSVASAFKNYGTNLRNSFRTGVNTHNIGNIEASVSGLNEVISGMNRFRDAVNTLQGRNFLEKATRTIAFGKGKFAVLDNQNYFQSNDLNSSSQRSRFMDMYGPQDWRNRIKQGLSEAEINETAARYVEDVQGSYDYRQLPAIAVEGSFAPFLSLSRWNIAQANRFTKNVLNPALTGDVKPLLMSLLSPIIGGYAVKELRERMSGGRKEKAPGVGEILAANPENYKSWFYRAATLADYSGYMGLIGNTLKIAADTVHNNPTQAFTNPLVDGTADTFRLAQDAIQAFNDGDFDLGLDSVSRVIENYAQTYRILANTVAATPERKRDIELANENRDLRTFRQLKDQTVPEVESFRPNPFKGRAEREFKRTEDLPEAASLLTKELLPRYIEELKTTKDVGKFQQRLRSLKGIPTISIPSPESRPQEFAAYLDFLSKSQGSEVSSNRLQSFLKRRAINRAKGSIVP